MNSPNSKLVPQSTYRQTAQRDQVLEVLKKAGGPLTAPEIYNLARKHMPEIGLATVYRALKLMQDDERVRYVCLPDGVSRYEIVGLGQHHFQCRVCQRIWTIRNNPLHQFGAMQLEDGFLVEAQDSTFYGLCPNCWGSTPTTVADQSRKP